VPVEWGGALQLDLPLSLHLSGACFFLRVCAQANLFLAGHLARIDTDTCLLTGQGGVIVGCSELYAYDDNALSQNAWGEAVGPPALDGVGSEAPGVGDINGNLVIVGYGYTRTDRIMQVVPWMP